MKTSSRITLQFSLWIGIIVGFLFIFLNLFFFWWWVTGESETLRNHVQLVSDKSVEPGSNSSIITIPKASINLLEYPHYWTINRIRSINKQRRIVGEYGKDYYAINVSQNISGQKWLIWVSLLLRCIVVGASFLLGTMFVRRSLRDLTTLTKKLKNRSPELKQVSLHASHLPADDEINAIADAIMWLENRVQDHYSHLRTFVSHVSHELKTPLMELGSDVDLMARTGNIERLPEKVRHYISHVQRMIDGMLLLTRNNPENPPPQKLLEMHDIVRDSIAQLQEIYAHNHIGITLDAPQWVIIKGNDILTRSLISNVIDNACKYSPMGETVTIHLSPTALIVKNNGFIDEKTRQKMWEPFWQADKNRNDWFGIWLSLAQQIADIHDRNITYSQEWSLVICTVQFT
jgi:signal transduction histidine kinase